MLWQINGTQSLRNFNIRMRKKINIVTAAPYVQNYGSMLLTYATQRLLESKGYEVEFLNYSRQSLQEAVSFKELLHALSIRDGSKEKPALIRFVMAIVLYPSEMKMAKVVQDFFGKYIHVGSIRYLDEKSLKINVPQADVYCTGGDQMWNEQCNFHKTLREFYLTFVPKGKPRISFSTSIGKEKFDDWELPEVLPLLQDYDLISVREATTKSYFDSLGIKNVYHLIDPTLLLPKGKWMEMVAPRQIKDDYILLYEISRKGNLTECAYELAQKTGKKLVRINRYAIDVIRRGVSILCPTPEVWLSLFCYADCVVTNSFHGVVFSTIFEKQFVLVPGANPTRLVNMMNTLGIHGRICTDKNKMVEVYDTKIDYDIIAAHLEKEHRKFDGFFELVAKLD